MSQTLLVTGASGQLGRLVVEQLAKSYKGKVIAATRTPEKLAAFEARGVEVRKADFDDAQSLDAAFRGVDRLLLISTDALDRPGRRFEQHAVAIDAAVRAGIKHVVYTSLSKAESSPLLLAPDHKNTEEKLKASGLNYTVLRNNFYTEMLLASLPMALARGQTYSAAGEGRMSLVTRADCASAAAAALASDFQGKRILEITGPAALSNAEILQLAGEVTGRTITRVPVSEAQLADGMKQANVPPFLADFLAHIDAAVSQGALDITTSDFKTLVGREPTSVREFLTANKAALLAVPPAH